MNIFTHFFTRAQNNPADIENQIRQNLIRKEAKIGKNVFGPIPQGHSREFFRIDKNTWIWQEQWKDNRSHYTKNTKYVVRERDVVKSVNGSAYQKVSIKEAENLESAIQLYVTRVKKEIYSAVA